MTEPVRGLTLWQPYATLVVLGIKGLETRSWRTPYRSTLYIHAAKHWDEAVEADCRRARDIIRRRRLAFDPGTPEDTHARLLWGETLGRIVAQVRLAGCDRVPAWGWTPGVDAPEWDFEFGDLRPGRYAWALADVVTVLPPVPWRGAQGLWPAPAELVAEVNGRIGATVEG